MALSAQAGHGLPDQFDNLDVLTPFGAIYRYEDYECASCAPGWKRRSGSAPTSRSAAAHAVAFIPQPDRPCEDIGGRAGKLALRPIETRTAPKLQTILLKPRLVVRESSSKRSLPSEIRVPRGVGWSGEACPGDSRFPSARRYEHSEERI